MDNKNLTQQKEEIEVLKSIYDKNWKADTEFESDYSYEVANSDVTLYITFNSNYPSEAPPAYQLSAPSMSRNAKQRIKNAFEGIYLENIGQPVIFQWIEHLREMVYDYKEQQSVTSSSSDDNSDSTNRKKPKEKPNPDNYKIVHGPTITDRKSTFQGHYCEVKSQDDVRAVISILLQNKKIHQAKHNISAYRIKSAKKSETSSIMQDCDDDGERHAGGRLLHLLEILDVENVLVVVTRWFGGIQIGPDRFRHINNAARKVLSEAGIIK